MSHFINSLLAMLNGMSPYILLGFFIAGVLHAFVKPSVMSRHLSGNGIGAVVKAALIGIPLPLCSCGVLPTAVSMRRNGASDAATTSFLIATPQTGVDSIAATYSLLGPVFAIMRPIGALVGALFGGVLVGKFSPVSSGAPDHTKAPACSCDDEDSVQSLSFRKKCVESLRYGFVDMVASVGKWLVIGLVVAAVITVFVPDSLFLGLARYPILAMLVMVLVAVPMYICATGSIPIALSLMLKGLTPGVAFVLLMAGPAANFASVMVLKKAMGVKATAIYIISVVITAIGFGVLIDYVLPARWFVPMSAAQDMGCHVTFSLFDTICSVVLVVLLIYALVIRRGHHQHNHNNIEMEETSHIYKIKGMMCPHCQATVKNGLEKLDGATSVEVNLSDGTATVFGNVAPEVVIAKIESLGYDYVK